MSQNCLKLNGPTSDWGPGAFGFLQHIEHQIEFWGRLLLAQGLSEDESERRKAQLAMDVADIELTLQGQGDAYSRLVARYQGEIGQWLWRFSRDRTVWEELVQTVFVEAYLHLARFRREVPLLHWLRKIATRVGYHHWQAMAKQRKRNVQPLTAEPAVTVEREATEQQDDAAMLHVLLNEMSPRDRLVLTMIHLEERTVAETAELIGWSQVMVKVQAFRARKKLKELWQRRVS